MSSGISFEECGGGPRGWASQFASYLRTNHNVGEDGSNSTQHWATHTETFNQFDLWTKSGRFCGNNDDCAKYWTPMKSVIYWPDETQVVNTVYSACKAIWLCKPLEIGQQVVKGAAGRFVDKGAGVFGDKWWSPPRPLRSPANLLPLDPCIEF